MFVRTINSFVCPTLSAANERRIISSENKRILDWFKNLTIIGKQDKEKVEMPRRRGDGY